MVVTGVVVANPADSKLLPAKVIPSGTEIAVPQQAINAPAVNAGRVIVPTPDILDSIVYWFQGCRQAQEFSDGVAFECPPKVAAKLIAKGEAREDRLFQLYDLEADVQINADDVWNLGYDGTGVTVAILDTGVDERHIELSDSIVATKNFIKGPGFDSVGHGTHVSGIVTANGVYDIEGNKATGVAPGANIIVGKVCGDTGCYESDIIAGIEWAVAQGADVLNLSLGGGNFGSHCDNDPLAAKVNWAVSQGLVVVVSSGNDGAGVSSPACASGAIAVGAVDKSDVRASWSNYGEALDIVAPGVDILSTYSCRAAGDCRSYWYAWGSGTSMSAPFIAGTAALVLQKNPGYTVDEVKEAIYSTALDLGTAGWDQYFGYGRVDALAAVNYQKVCTSNEDCNDNNECTEDVCNPDGTCSNTQLADNTACSGGICCSGNCVVSICSSDADCDDENVCTTDVCNNAGTCSALCSNRWPACNLSESDGCCGPECTSETDVDCPTTDSCLNCFKGVCDGKCNPAKEDATCPDCQ